MNKFVNQDLEDTWVHISQSHVMLIHMIPVHAVGNAYSYHIHNVCINNQAII